MVGVRERIATSMDVPGVLQTIFNVDYVLTPIAANNFVMDSSFSFASSV